MIWFYFLFALTAQAKEIALSFDDAPRGSTHYFTGEERTHRLISALREAGVPQVVFFCNIKGFSENGRKRVRN